MILVDATTLIALGRLDRLALLSAFDGALAVPPAVHDEIRTDPERGAVERFPDSDRASVLDSPEESTIRRAKQVLDSTDRTGDVELLAAAMARDDSVAVVSDDRAVRTAVEGVGGDVTGTLGVVVRAAADGLLTRSEARETVAALDSHGLHMTAELRNRVKTRIDDVTDA